MSGLIQYIQSLEDRSFEAVREHFTSRGCRVTDGGEYYMICVPNNLEDQTTEFGQAATQAVGSILRKDNHALVCYGFPKTKEVKIDDQLSAELINASEYIDGTLLRAYHNGLKWCLSTSGTIDAYGSYWISSKSFGELFDECLGRIYGKRTTFSESELASGLDVDCTYQFILSHPSVHLDQNRKPYLYHVGTFSTKGFSYVEHTVHQSIHTPNKKTFHSYAELVESLSSNQEIRGYIFYLNGIRYKVFQPSYLYTRSLLGNTSNLYLRYIEAKAEGKDVELLNYFPNLRYYSSWVDRCMGVISKGVLECYVNKFILKDKKAPIDYYYRPIVYELHGAFIKSQQKVNYQTVYSLIWSYHPKRINFLLNGLKMIKTGDVVIEYNASKEAENNEPLV